jgi:hypothetical protein
MKYWHGIFLLVVGVLSGFALRGHWAIPAVHAQEQYPSVGGCIVTVPKDWGEFKGASEYGIAFQDQNATLRFVQHPLCSSPLSSNSAPSSVIDLEIKWK